MPKKKLEKLRKSDIESLRKELSDINLELMKLRALTKAGGAPENPAKIRELRRQRARILTIIKEKEREMAHASGI